MSTKVPQLNIALRVKIVEKFRTNTRFAIASDVSLSKLSLVINGLQKAKPEEKQKWADILGCRVDDIFKVDTEELNIVS